MRAAKVGTCAEGTLDQDWAGYSAQEHGIWAHLYQRQCRQLPKRACGAFLQGMEDLAFARDGIPDFRRLSDRLMKATGWQVVAVPGLVPDEVFFDHLANRRFPATRWIRKPEQLDYLEEPDVFHDIFGHVPLLMNPVFADFMAAYGRGGLKALDKGVLPNLARLYWYTVEFGLIKGAEGLEIYGAGILSSHSEVAFCLDSASPNHLAFDPLRVLRTNYRIDDFQEVYFVINDFEELLALADLPFDPLYAAVRQHRDLEPGDLCSEDQVLQQGSGDYHTPQPFSQDTP
ncbi:phenylalanine 4-monooxygenase [Rhodovibrionaceae bacterium A322]